MQRLSLRSFQIILFLNLLFSSASGQNSYYMSDNYVKDCNAFFYDSDNHPINSGEYGHNEDFIFTICPENVISIDLIFSSFCTESGLDVMKIYAGPDTSAPLIGSYSGLSLPPPISTNSCITIWFVTDGNVSCNGWDAFWTAEVAAPNPPDLSLLTSLTCSLTTLDYQFSFPIQCDTIIQAFWTLNGPVNNSVTATATNCSSDSTNLAQLNLSSGLNKSGTYYLQFTAKFKDACDSIWTLTSYDTIQISDCPLDVEIFVDKDTICPGECIDIWAEGSGGDSTNYTYTWQSLPSSSGPHQVCPTSTTSYTVSLTDGTSFTANHTSTVFVHSSPLVPSDTVICQSANQHNLIAYPTGGEWYGQGVIDTFNGIYHPDTAGPGIHNIVYIDTNECKDSFNISITEIDAGPILAACPGTNSFTVNGSPPGGIWSGNSISSSGVFNPSIGGSYVITYANNACTDTTLINVAAISLQGNDTICQSDPKFDLSFTPAGGIWSGTAISDSINGTFKPANAIPGDNYVVYNSNGCSDSVNIYTIEIDAGPLEHYCPYQNPITLSGSPSGGTWSGTGITNANQGIFDPSTGVHGNNFTLTYNVNGCTDTKVIRIRETRIYNDTIVFCPDDNALRLNWANIKSSPGGGSWSGPGIYINNNKTFFGPQIAGPGNHKIVYELNTCTDTALMIVNDNSVLTDTSICYLSTPITLSALPSGGVWNGPGITNSNLGTFDPSGLTIDTFEIIYTSLYGCTDTTNIGLYDLPNLSMTSIPSSLCFMDTNINLSPSPIGGILSGNGIIGTSFNPTLAGSGMHQITYTYGGGNCLQSISEYILIGDTLNVSLNASTDSSCINEPIDLTAIGSGGEINNYSYSWNNGLGNNNAHTVYPNITSTYIVSISDGCSEIAIDSTSIFVHNGFSANFNTSDSLCHGEKGYAAITVNGNSSYDYFWNNHSSSDSLIANVGNTYTVTITDIITKCSIEETVEIPGYDIINAYFTTNYTSGCIPTYDSELDLIDISQGGKTGIWNFGDGSSAPYQLLINPSHLYTDTGQYRIDLIIFNEGGCSDTFSRDICIIPKSLLYVPNAFTPNNDGMNDEFKVILSDVTPIELRIFNRWGKEIFKTNDPEEGWDGNYDGKKAMSGAYVYKLKYEMLDQPSNKPHIKRGTFILLRNDQGN